MGTGGDIQQKGKFKVLVFQEDPIPFLSVTSWSLYKENSVLILKSVGESTFFQSNKFTECDAKHEKEVANPLMAFNLLKIIHPFRGKKHLKR